MKNVFKSVLSAFCIVLLAMAFTTVTFAHGGRTDGSGGHKDNKNKSGLGYYHYHCGGYPAHLHPGGYCPYHDTFPSSVKIKVKKTTLKLGETMDFDAVVYPSNACDTYADIECSDDDVIRISGDTIEAVGYGTATITAETFNGKKAKIKITVKEIVAKKVTVDGLHEDNKYFVHDKLSLKAIITPENVDNPSIEWSSSDSKIATVSLYGEVELLSEGKVTITATASNGVTGKVTLNVKEIPVDDVDIQEEKIELLLGEEYDLAAEISPSDASFPELQWGSENVLVATVTENGTVRATGVGEATISAVAKSGKYDSVVVSVREIVAESAEISGVDELLIGKTSHLKVEFTPQDTTIQDVVWSVDDTDVIGIDQEGNILAKNVGKTIIRIAHKDVEANLEIEVLPILVTEISIGTDIDGSIEKGDIAYFAATVLPEDATYPEITWSVDDTEVAEINEDGLLIAKKAGKVKVIATTGDGFSEEYEVRVRVQTKVVLLGACATMTAGVLGVAGTSSARKKRQK
ncbi:MAG: Ig-like domain-containing protein [Clostridia bacterium]|nr:Ig-like domain-containing protein [Clostridia bacterium]